MRDDVELRRLRRRRDAARNLAVLAVVTLFIFGVGFRFGGARFGGILPLSVVLAPALAFAFAALAWWAWCGWRLHRADDPWAYDPELDGPVAQVMEGRAMPPPASRPGASPLGAFTLAVMAAAAAGACVLGARASPGLLSLALWTCAAGFLVVAALLAWAAQAL